MIASPLLLLVSLLYYYWYNYFAVPDLVALL